MSANRNEGDSLLTARVRAMLAHLRRARTDERIYEEEDRFGCYPDESCFWLARRDLRDRGIMALRNRPAELQAFLEGM